MRPLGNESDVSMNRTWPAVLALILISGVARAELGWRDEGGNPVPDTDSQKSVAGFGGMLIVTPDLDWEKRWETPPEVAPQFTRATSLEKGEELFILTVFTNPKLDESGAAGVSVDIDVTRPDGSSSMHVEGAACFEGELSGPLRRMFLCKAVIGFVGEPSDPTGTWSVRIAITDTVRQVTIPLSTSFELMEARTTPVESRSGGNPTR